MNGVNVMSDKKGTIYAIINQINNKIYIGQTLRFDRRITEHKSKLNNQYHNNSYLQRSWNKYGEEKFEFKILEDNICKNELYDRERYWIDHFNTFEGEGYNLTCGGFGFSGESHPNSKINKNTALEIINERIEKEISCCTLAEKYKTNSTTILQIINGEHWTTCDLPNSKLPDFNRVKPKRNHHQSKIDVEDTLKILEERSKNNTSIYKLADKYDVGITTIRRILNGNHWTIKYVEKDYNYSKISNQSVGEKHHEVKYELEDYKNMIDLFLNKKYSFEDIKKIYNISEKTYYSVINGRHWSSDFLDYDFDILRNISKNSGEYSKLSKISLSESKEIIKKFIKGFSFSDLSNGYNVSKNTIRLICKGEHWTVDKKEKNKLNKIYNERTGIKGFKNPNAKIKKDDAKLILKYRENGLSYNDISQKEDVNISISVLSKICRGEHWTTTKNEKGEVIVDE